MLGSERVGTRMLHLQLSVRHTVTEKYLPHSGSAHITVRWTVQASGKTRHPFIFLPVIHLLTSVT